MGIFCGKLARLIYGMACVMLLCSCVSNPNSVKAGGSLGLSFDFTSFPFIKPLLEVSYEADRFGPYHHRGYV